MSLRYDDFCAACSAPTPAREKAWWDSVAKHVICTRCRPVDVRGAATQPPPPLSPPQPVNVGIAGLSAAEQHARRLRRHEQRSVKNGDAGAPAPHHVVAWEKGADGEKRLGDFLDASLAGHAIVLHDRKVPGAGGKNIDHIVISSNGVWVIDAKNWTGVVEVRKPSILKSSSPGLYVNARRRPKAVESMAWQCEAVLTLTDPLGLSVPVFPMLCFTDSDWPAFRTAEIIDGVSIAWPEKAVELVGQPGPGEAATIGTVAQQISAGLPASASLSVVR